MRTVIPKGHKKALTKEAQKYYNLNPAISDKSQRERVIELCKQREKLLNSDQFTKVRLDSKTVVYVRTKKVNTPEKLAKFLKSKQSQ